ncbi:hypothetical protein SAMN05216185_103440 [Pseudomonas guariconensis]|uniref:hypothetical protein n=1 Tax=Pseudomonas guariconensis TaxID=1288410 RepID=UPI00088FFE45|nr:hypothetical protein [Pseudomonas guariconensis]SDC63062.1 hypothetical protein SAMN05216185_103440 [Pseudomonas guariconensis]
MSINKFARFRRSLEKNKIFFEITASLLIGSASLAVSYSALNLNDKILAATEVSALPHLSIGSRARMDNETHKYSEEELFLSNNGAPLTNLDWQTKTFVVIEGSNLQRPFVLLPVNGYYFVQFTTNNVVGELSSKVGHKNLQKFSSLYQEVVDHNNSQSNTLDYYFAKIITVSRVEYEDRLGRRDVVYFRDNKRISEESARSIWDYNISGRMQDIDNVRLKDLKDAAAAPGALVLDDLP